MKCGWRWERSARLGLVRAAARRPRVRTSSSCAGEPRRRRTRAPELLGRDAPATPSLAASRVGKLWSGAADVLVVPLLEHRFVDPDLTPTPHPRDRRAPAPPAGVVWLSPCTVAGRAAWHRRDGIIPPRVRAITSSYPNNHRIIVSATVLSLVRCAALRILSGYGSACQ